MSRIGDYIAGTRAEMNHVNWPTKPQTIRFTAAVIVVSIVVSILLGVADFVFGKLLTLFF